jgi:pyruvate dehydrogenase kinase 2/3/4
LIPIEESMGIGLPMAQVYANYWGGNLQVYSMNGFGTDMYETIKTGGVPENFSSR